MFYMAFRGDTFLYGTGREIQIIVAESEEDRYPLSNLKNSLNI